MLAPAFVTHWLERVGPQQVGFVTARREPLQRSDQRRARGGPLIAVLKLGDTDASLGQQRGRTAQHMQIVAFSIDLEQINGRPFATSDLPVQCGHADGDDTGAGTSRREPRTLAVRPEREFAGLGA